MEVFGNALGLLDRELVFATDPAFNLPGPGSTADAGPALNAALAFAQEEGRPLWLPPNGVLKVSTGIVAKHGRNASDTKRYKIDIRGNGCSLLPSAGTTALTIQPRCLLSDVGTGRGIADVKIRDITFNGFYANASTNALLVGQSGYACDSFSWMQFENLVVSGGFTSPNTVKLRSMRHAIWKDVVLRAGTFLITEASDGHFCGDMIFDNCEFAGSTAIRPLQILSSGGSGSTMATMAQMRGLHFRDCDIYGSGTRIEVGPGAQCGDIWFSSCAWDGPDAASNEYGIEFAQSGAAGRMGQMFQMHITEPYIVGYKAPAIRATQTGNGTIQMFNVNGGAINNVAPATTSGLDNSVLAIIGVSGASVRGLRTDTITGTGNTCIGNFEGCTSLIVNDIVATNNTSVGSAINIGTGANYYSISNIIAQVTGQVINDYTGGTPVKNIGASIKIP